MVCGGQCEWHSCPRFIPGIKAHDMWAHSKWPSKYPRSESCTYYISILTTPTKVPRKIEKRVPKWVLRPLHSHVQIGRHTMRYLCNDSTTVLQALKRVLVASLIPSSLWQQPCSEDLSDRSFNEYLPFYTKRGIATPTSYVQLRTRKGMKERTEVRKINGWIGPDKVAVTLTLVETWRYFWVWFYPVVMSWKRRGHLFACHWEDYYHFMIRE